MFIAGYFDYLLFGIPWTFVVAWLGHVAPVLQALSWPLKLGVFLAIELVLVAKVNWSPGQMALGIVALRRSPFSGPGDPSAAAPIYLVDPWLHRNERWWTILFGVLAVLDGTKGMVRWTQWWAPPPVLGMDLDPLPATIVQIAVGAAEILVGVAALRLRSFVLPLGASLHGFMLVSAWLSWAPLAAWVERYVRERSAIRGTTPNPGQVEFVKAFFPTAAVVLAIVALVWVILVGLRARGATRVATSPPGSPPLAG